MLNTLVTVLPPSERATLAHVDNWQATAVDRLAAATVDDTQAASYDFDFAHITTTIGRTDLGLAHMLHRLDVARRLDGKLRENLETAYLREVGAFAHDLCYGVSFAKSAQGQWQTRPTIGYPAQLDFLHNVTPDGMMPAGAGQIVTLDHGRPYGMTAPEEDCVTVWTAYGVLAPILKDNRAPGNADEQTTSAAAVANWALSARTRTSPAPSIAPYLKLVWVEWFMQAFEPLKASDSGAGSFVYQAQDVTKITAPEQVLALKKLPAASAGQAALIDEFISLRSYLERNYGPPSSRSPSRR